MGHRPNALLAYGYDLSGGQVDWEFTILDGPDRSNVDWYGERTGSDVAGDVEKVLRLHDGITLKEHGYLDEPSYVLAAHVERADWDGPVELDLAALERLRIEQAWDSRLSAAIESLGIEPHQDSPRWLLLAHGT